jgi:hypothetical protein
MKQKYLRILSVHLKHQKHLKFLFANKNCLCSEIPSEVKPILIYVSNKKHQNQKDQKIRRNSLDLFSSFYTSKIYTKKMNENAISLFIILTKKIRAGKIIAL